MNSIHQLEIKCGVSLHFSIIFLLYSKTDLETLYLTRLLILSFFIIISVTERLVDSLAFLQLTLCITMKDLICDQVLLVIVFFIIVKCFYTVIFLLL